VTFEWRAEQAAFAADTTLVNPGLTLVNPGLTLVNPG
jgi:hypothetical protein